jgi:hypothetical protein
VRRGLSVRPNARGRQAYSELPIAEHTANAKIRNTAMMIQNALQAEYCLGGGGGRDDIRTHDEPEPQSEP